MSWFKHTLFVYKHINKQDIQIYRWDSEETQVCLLTPTLVNIFLRRKIAGTLADLDGTVSIGWRVIVNIWLADNTARNAKETNELRCLIYCLDKTTKA